MWLRPTNIHKISITTLFERKNFLAHFTIVLVLAETPPRHIVLLQTTMNLRLLLFLRWPLWLFTWLHEMNLRFAMIGR
jgi:hypothetical protein